MQFFHPFTAILAGSTGSGKSEWTANFIENCHLLVDPPPRDILYCYGELSTVVKRLMGKIRVREGIPTREELDALEKPALLILDDLMPDFSKRKDKFLDIIFTRGSHHWDVSAIVITQDPFASELRVPKKNCHYLILMRAPQLLMSVRQLGHQLFPQQSKGFMEAYKSATQKLFGYFIINNHPKTPLNSKLRLTTQIFPSEHLISFVLQ